MNGESTDRYGEIKTQLERLIESTEKLAVASVQVTERMVGVNERVLRCETSLEKMIIEEKIIDSPIHKADICPFSHSFEEYNKVLWGGPDFGGLIGKTERVENKVIPALEKSISRMKGMMVAVGALFLAVLPTAILITYYMVRGK